ncbi:uncharacterized, partial [Tachysurus ichikawai]
MRSRGMKKDLRETQNWDETKAFSGQTLRFESSPKSEGVISKIDKCNGQRKQGQRSDTMNKHTDRRGNISNRQRP